MKRFDEVELIPDAASALTPQEPPVETVATSRQGLSAPLLSRLLAFLTDASLFAALALALSPLIQDRGELAVTLQREWPALGALAGFLLLVSYFYSVGTWLLWGRTIGGAIFDVAVRTVDGTSLDTRRASLRWLWSFVSLLLAGVPSLLALLPSRRSMADRLSSTVTVQAR